MTQAIFASFYILWSNEGKRIIYYEFLKQFKTSGELTSFLK